MPTTVVTIVMYTSTEAVCCTPETHILYANHAATKKTMNLKISSFKRSTILTKHEVGKENKLTKTGMKTLLTLKK